MGPKAQAASSLLRRLGVALKTYALYPPPSPVTNRAVEELLDGLHRYTDAYGPFTVRVSKRSFHVDEVTLKDATAANLAFHLYTRKVIGITILPGVTEGDVSTFLAAMRMDRAVLEAAGGIVRPLQQAGVGTIRIAEIVLALGAPTQNQEWNALWDLVGDGRRLAPEARELVADALHSGPMAIGALFQQLQAVLRQPGDGADPQDQAQSAFRLVKNLDRFIVNEPFEDQQQLYANLAAALVLLEEPLRTPVEQALAAHAVTDETARLLLNSLSGRRLIEIVPEGSLEHLDQEAAVTPGDEGQQGRMLDPETEMLLAQSGVAATRAATFDPQSAAGREPPEDRLPVASATDEASVMREVIGTLTDILSNQHDESDLAEIGRSLTENLPWLVQHQEYGLLRVVLQELQKTGQRAEGYQQVVTGIFRSLAKGPLLHLMVESLWQGQETERARDIRVCLQMLAGVVSPLMLILGDEPRAPVRRMLCDLIVAMGRDHVDEVGGFIEDPQWYLVRNTASILGRLGDPRGLVHLACLARHPEYRVRRETAEALVRIGTLEAQAQLALFLDDPDERMRVKAAEWLSDAGVRQALPRLLHLLEQPDPWHQRFRAKKSVIAALVRARAREALPALARLSRPRILLRRRSRILHRLAKDAVARIESPEQASDRRLLAVTTGAGRP